MSQGWYGFDLDGTLAVYDGWQGVEHVGEPIAGMVNLARGFIESGIEVRIFTARVSEESPLKRGMAIQAIEQWCELHLGKKLPVTNAKDFACIAVFDDRAVAVEHNTGRILGGSW